MSRVEVGFFGKLPCRRDFLRAGLPPAFVAAWDDWVSGGLARSRVMLGDVWEAAWLEAPVWRFALSGGLCGPVPVLGLWLPSVDGAGRYFPLTLAAVFTTGPALRDEGWLDRAETAGRTALDGDDGPAVLGEAMRAIGVPQGEPVGAGSHWWTEGSPRVGPATLATAAMPGQDRFASMLVSP